MTEPWWGLCSDDETGSGETSDEWWTPPDGLDAPQDVLGTIDLDPASCPEAQANVRATKYFTKADDGLAQEWGGRVWLNPPYSNPAPWVKKLIEEYESGRVSEAILLVNDATDTTWFHEALQACSAICFMRGRIKFLHRDKGETGPARQGQNFLYFGDGVEKFARRFSDVGQVVRPHQPKPAANWLTPPEPLALIHIAVSWDGVRVHATDGMKFFPAPGGRT
jgi:phage N-6-adenine-methyltransferase